MVVEAFGMLYECPDQEPPEDESPEEPPTAENWIVDFQIFEGQEDDSDSCFSGRIREF